MTDLLLVRHGETVWHAENRYAGRSDVALTDRGRDQAGQLAAWTARHPPDRVLCSTLRRSLDTARSTGLPLAPDPRLAEVDFGDGEGRTRDEMAERFPDALAAFLAGPATTPLPGGEPGAAAVARATPALAEACADAERVLVVTHNTLIRLLLCAGLGLPLDRYRDAFPQLDNVAVTTLRVPPPGTTGWPYPAALLGLNVPV